MDASPQQVLWSVGTASAVLLIARYALAQRNKLRRKTVPPVLCTISDFIDALASGNGPPIILTKFRSNPEVAAVGACEIQNATFLLGRRAFFANDAGVARAVLDHSQSVKWAQGFRFFIDTTSGMNMVADPDNGPRWKHVRKSTAQAFSPVNLQRMTNEIALVIEDWVQTRIATSHGQPLDILKEMNRVTAHVISRVAFAYDLPDDECDVLLDNLNICWYEFAQKSMGNPFRAFEWSRWMYSGIRDARRAAQKLFQMCEHMLETYRRKISASAENRQPHMIIDLINQDSDYDNDRERVSDLVAYIVAGFDTNANTLSFCFRELAKNMQEQVKLRTALLACSTDEERRNCPQLRYVVKETLRMFPPPANGSGRINKADIPVHGTPYIIPANSIVFMPFYTIQRDSNVFENPDSFQPSRWENPSEKMLQAYVPFASGKRNCQGQGLAYSELHCILARVFLDHEFCIVEEGTTNTPILMQPKGLVLSAHPVSVLTSTNSDENEQYVLVKGE